MKRAVIRDASIPVGQAAPLHVVCDCGAKVTVWTPGEWDYETVACPDCGTVYDSHGWLLRPGSDLQNLVAAVGVTV